MLNDNINFVVSVGAMLADDLQAMGLTQKELAEKIGVAKSVINEIIKGKRKMSSDVAIKLEPIFGVPAHYWLNLQSDYEIACRKSDMYLINNDATIQSGSYSAVDVANWFINRTARDSESTGEFLTHLKLQKLLYLLQLCSIKKTGKAVFAEPIVHWEYGPVVKVVYDKYKSLGANPIESAPPASFDKETERMLEKVYKIYERYSASGLVTITHRKQSWLNTDKGDVMTLEMISKDELVN